MRFKNVAKFFDRDSCYDGYTGTFLFKAQLASYDGSQPDGTPQRRRTVSLAPELVASVPTHRVVLVHGDRWILGNFIQDGFYDQAVRSTAYAKYATGLYAVLTPAQAANNAAAPRSIYGSADSKREAKNPDGSDYRTVSVVHVAGTETGLLTKFLRIGSTYYHVKSDTYDINGHLELVVDLVEWDYAASPTVTVAYTGAWNPVTETFAAGATFQALALPRTMLYREDVQDAAKNLPGDTTLLVDKLAYLNPAAGAKLTLAGASWAVEGYVTYGDAWALHVRRM